MTTDTDKMYWCLKCSKQHQRKSDIGRWHEPIERPELSTSNIHRNTTRKPSKNGFAGAVALALALDTQDKTEVTVDTYKERYHSEGFDEFGTPEEALSELQETFNDVIKRRHSGKEWLTFEASGSDSMRLKSCAREYDSRGMSFGTQV